MLIQMSACISVLYALILPNTNCPYVCRHFFLSALVKFVAKYSQICFAFPIILIYPMCCQIFAYTSAMYTLAIILSGFCAYVLSAIFKYFPNVRKYSTECIHVYKICSSTDFVKYSLKLCVCLYNLL